MHAWIIIKNLTWLGSVQNNNCSLSETNPDGGTQPPPPPSPPPDLKKGEIFVTITQNVQICFGRFVKKIVQT